MVLIAEVFSCSTAHLLPKSICLAQPSSEFNIQSLNMRSIMWSFLLLYSFTLGVPTTDGLHGRESNIRDDAGKMKTYTVYPRDRTNADMLKRTEGWNGVSERDTVKRPELSLVNNPVPVAPPPAPAPYAQGTCGIHVTEWRSAYADPGVYDLEITMTDNDQAQIGYTQRTPASADNPLHFQSKLEDDLVCVPESQNNYIAFALGKQQWPSDGDFAPGVIPSCNTQQMWSDDNGFEAVRKPPLHTKKAFINVK